MTDEKSQRSGRRPSILSVLLFLEMIFTVAAAYTEEGTWGDWFQTRRCNFCLGLRYKFNCTFGDGRADMAEDGGSTVCSQGLYYQRVNKVLNGCFAFEEGSSLVDSYQEDYDIVRDKPETTVDKLKSRALWHEGIGRWGRCLWTRKYENRRTNIYNRRGRQRRAYVCPTDNSTAWREEWQHCCAGSWSEWKVLEDCPHCGWGVRRTVRICAVPNLLLDIEALAKKREFLSEWQVDECRRKPCQMVEMAVPLCVNVCADNNWHEGTVCKRYGKIAYAGECCIRNIRHPRATCGFGERTASEEEQYRTTTMVAVILGTEAVIIVVAAVVVVMYNVGRLPTIVSGSLSACCGGPATRTPRSEKYKAGSVRRASQTQAKMKAKARVRVKVRNVDELNHFLEQNKRSSSGTASSASTSRGSPINTAL